MRTQQDLISLIEYDDWMMRALKIVADRHLKDWWIVGGFVRAKVWDTLHDYSERTQPGDIDVVFFDPALPESTNKEIEQDLLQSAPEYPWEVYNQAHMHTFSGDEPYTSATDAFSRWAETVSTVGVSLSDRGNAMVAAPHGLDDLFGMIVRPTPHPDSNKDVYWQRLHAKGWRARWPKVTVAPS